MMIDELMTIRLEAISGLAVGGGHFDCHLGVRTIGHWVRMVYMH